MKSREFAVRILESHLKLEKLASTYLITGQDAATRETLAFDFACALQCGKKKAFKACECRDCFRVRSRNHPDIQWGGDPEARSLKIEMVRELIGWASLKPYEGRWKLCIIPEASRFTLEAANALLKTLEEPPSQTVFCLLADSKDHLLATIQSRSFEIRLGPVNIQTSQAFNMRAARDEFEGQAWEDVLQRYDAIPRQDLKVKLDELTDYLYHQLKHAAANASQVRVRSWIDALDRIYETREAVDSNANQKLALSRLAMQLRKTIGGGA